MNIGACIANQGRIAKLRIFSQIAIRYYGYYDDV